MSDKEQSFLDYLKEVEEAPQPESCSIDNEDCEACGS